MIKNVYRKITRLIPEDGFLVQGKCVKFFFATNYPNFTQIDKQLK
jgi:hypothetical protein